jgi:hypothetical protein
MPPKKGKGKAVSEDEDAMLDALVAEASKNQKNAKKPVVEGSVKLKLIFFLSMLTF